MFTKSCAPPVVVVFVTFAAHSVPPLRPVPQVPAGWQVTCTPWHVRRLSAGFTAAQSASVRHAAAGCDAGHLPSLCS